VVTRCIFNYIGFIHDLAPIVPANTLLFCVFDNILPFKTVKGIRVLTATSLYSAHVAFPFLYILWYYLNPSVNILPKMNIIISRPIQINVHHPWIYRLIRPYKVFIDGKLITTIKSGEEKNISLPENAKILFAKVWYAGSNKFDLSAINEHDKIVISSSSKTGEPYRKWMFTPKNIIPFYDWYALFRVLIISRNHALCIAKHVRMATEIPKIFPEESLESTPSEYTQ